MQRNILLLLGVLLLSGTTAYQFQTLSQDVPCFTGMTQAIISSSISIAHCMAVDWNHFGPLCWTRLLLECARNPAVFGASQCGSSWYPLHMRLHLHLKLGLFQNGCATRTGSKGLEGLGHHKPVSHRQGINHDWALQAGQDGFGDTRYTGVHQQHLTSCTLHSQHAFLCSAAPLPTVPQPTPPLCFLLPHRPS
jgi:hypothetical protein